MPHGFNSDAEAIEELFRRVEHLEQQLRVHADNTERAQRIADGTQPGVTATPQPKPPQE